MTLYTEHS